MWDAGTIADLQAAEQYKTGQVGSHALNAVVRAARDNQAHQDQPTPRKVSCSDANGTAQTLLTSAGRLYHVRVTNTDNDAIEVVLYSGGTTIIVAALHCPAGTSTAPAAAEAAFFAGNHGNGIVIPTDLRVKALKSSDGTTAADAGNTVTCIVSGS